MKSHAPALGVATLAVMAISAYRPSMVGDWLLENILVVVLLTFLAITYRAFPLSNTAYWMIFGFLCIHEWGAHHKYADVPLGEWMKSVFDTQRNHYDRVAHFSFGLFLSYPIYEILVRWAGVRGLWQWYLPVDVSLATGASYEVLEAIVASIVSPEAGEAFVGLQGDMWDAQKDIALAGIGACITMASLAAFRRAKRRIQQ